MIDNNHNGYQSNQLPPSSSSGIPSVRNSTKRQRLVLPVNSGKRQPAPLSYDPNLSDQRRKGNAFNIQLTQVNNPSADSRGNQSNSSYNSKGGVHIISKKYISFAGQSQTSNNSNQNQLSSRQNSQQNNNTQKKIIVGKIPLANLQSDHSPRDFPSGRENKKGSSRGQQHQQQQHQRKQLAFRRQQVMDITDDANTNSMRTIHANNDGDTNTLTIDATGEINNGNNSNSHLNAYSQPPPAFNYFYHASGNEGVLNRLNSKKSFRAMQQNNGQNSNLMVKQSSKNDLLTSSLNKQTINEQFQFTRKQNLIGDSSVSSTREKQGGQIFTLKKQSIQHLNNQQPTSQKEPSIPQIGKRRPLIIRKNNFIQANGNQLPQNQTQPLSHINISAINNENLSQISPNQTSNMNTLFSATSGRMNNTNSIGGLTSEASLSQTRHGITQILKSLNSTSQSNDLQQNHSLKDPRLIKINQSKKKLDTARKSRLQQLQNEPQNYQQLQQLGGVLNNVPNSLSQQPPQNRNGQVYLSNLNKKKRSFLIPKVKIDNGQQQNNTINSFNPTSQKPSARQESQRNYAQSTVVPQKGLIQISAESTQNVEQILKQISQSEERTQQIENNSNQNKVLTRGQLMRIVKKQHNTNNNSNSNKPNESQIQHETSLLTRTMRANTDKITIESKDEKSQSSSLVRVESQKELVAVKQIKEELKINEKHQVKEELVILEQLNDSSCTPGDLQSLNTMHQLSPEKKIDYIVENDFNELLEEQLKLETIEMTQDNRDPQSEITQKQSQPIQQEQLSTDIPHIISVGAQEIQKKNTGPLTQQTVSLVPQTQEINPDQTSSQANAKSNPKSLQKDLVLGSGVQQQQPAQQTSSNNNKQRLFNNSAVEVKSPVGTATSFKSQNSQQAGPNLDEIIKFPMKPGKALKLFLNQLADYEKGEILDYQEIYYLGLNAQKIHGSPKNEHNYGYDDEKGDYKIVMKDHIGYRYEVLEFLGKGSFGTALKCFDHKTKEEVALKIVKNKKKYQYQAGVELKILNFLKENDPDDIMNVIHMKDYVIFRKHLCISFELLSMNLFEFLKINDFNGFDHNLIRRFAIQLLYALKYLKEFQIIHCDLKPENILLKEPNKSGIKIIDFGSSTFIDERVYTYIQSRFYRAPEIMLGIPYTCGIDMWSFGCIMAELYIGYPIFPGESENDQMSRIIEMISLPNRHVYEQSQRRHKFFIEGQNGDYEAIMLKNSRGKLRKPGGKPLSLLLGDEDLDFLDFVQRCLEWDPETRLTPDEALRHIWVLKGLPPQVLIHHQRMHNIQTPELPEPVREARDKFFLEMTIQNDQNTSQLGSRVKSSQQQSSKSNQNSNNKQKQTQIKNETIKSLERAQLKNQLHQLNPQKIHQQSNQIQSTKPNNIVIHSKVIPPQQQNIDVKNSIVFNKEEALSTFKSPKFQTIVNNDGNKIFKRRVNHNNGQGKTKIIQ